MLFCKHVRLSCVINAYLLTYLLPVSFCGLHSTLPFSIAQLESDMHFTISQRVDGLVDLVTSVSVRTCQHGELTYLMSQ